MTRLNCGARTRAQCRKLWGRPPGLRGSPWTRCLVPGITPRGYPKRSARGPTADEGVRPTIYAAVLRWEKYAALRTRAPLLACVLLFLVSASGQIPPVFLSHYSAQDVAPSADPDSAFWKGIAGVAIDHSVLGPEMAQFRAEVRSRWTKAYVYFLFAGKYEKLTLKSDPDLKNETYRLWEKDCFEVYLGADFEHTNRYREFQMSPAGEFLDLDIDSTRPRPGYNGENLWNSGMQVKARVDETKKIWHGEMKIPIAAVDARPAQEGNENAHQFVSSGWRESRPRFPGLAAAGSVEPAPSGEVRNAAAGERLEAIRSMGRSARGRELIAGRFPEASAVGTLVSLRIYGRPTNSQH